MDNETRYKELQQELASNILRYGPAARVTLQSRDALAAHNNKMAREAAQLQRIQQEDDIMAKSEMVVDELSQRLANERARNQALQEANKTLQTALVDQMGKVPEPEVATVTSESEPVEPTFSVDDVEFELDERGLPRLPSRIITDSMNKRGE